jgi:PPP family 3-phenylpropionic acid transporter
VADVADQRMRMIRYGSLLAFIAFLGVFVSQQFWWMAFIITAYSFFWNAVLPQFEVVTLACLEGRFNRYSQIRLWGSVGFIVAVVCLGIYFDYFAISALPWFIAFFLLGVWLCSLLVTDTHKTPRSKSDGQSFFKVIKQPSVIAFLLTCFLLQLSHGPYYTFFSVYLERYDYSRATIGFLWSFGVIAEVVVFIVMHKLLANYRLKSILLVSLVLSVIRWVLIAYFVESGFLLLIAQSLHAASFASFHAYAVEMVRRLFAGGYEVQGMALYSSLSYGAGGALGAVFSGLLWDINAQLTFLMAAIACLLAIAISFFIKYPNVPSAA